MQTLSDQSKHPLEGNTQQASETITFDRNEWEDFLDKLAEIEKKYRIVLQELDTTRARLHALDESKKQPHENQPVQKTASEPSKSAKKSTETTTGGILTRLRTALQDHRVPSPVPTTQAFVSSKSRVLACSRCGYQIVHATRVCQRCGTDFGRLVCSCGRKLAGSDKFCDSCGNKVPN